MTGPSEIPTPLGALKLSLSCGESSLGDPDSAAELPSGACVVQWRDVGGLMVDLLVTRYDSLALVPEGFPERLLTILDELAHRRGPDGADVQTGLGTF